MKKGTMKSVLKRLDKVEHKLNLLMNYKTDGGSGNPPQTPHTMGPAVLSFSPFQSSSNNRGTKVPAYSGRGLRAKAHEMRVNAYPSKGLNPGAIRRRKAEMYPGNPGPGQQALNGPPIVARKLYFPPKNQLPIGNLAKNFDTMSFQTIGGTRRKRAKRTRTRKCKK